MELLVYIVAGARSRYVLKLDLQHIDLHKVTWTVTYFLQMNTSTVSSAGFIYKLRLKKVICILS